MILGTSRAVRVYAYPEAVDLRKGYDGLFGLVKQGLSRDPLSATCFSSSVKGARAARCFSGTGRGCASSTSVWNVGASRLRGVTTARSFA